MDKWAQLGSALGALSKDVLAQVSGSGDVERLAMSCSRESDRRALSAIRGLVSTGIINDDHVRGYACAVEGRAMVQRVQLVLSGPDVELGARPTPAVFSDLVASAVKEVLFVTYALRYGEFAIDVLLGARERGVAVRGVVDRKVHSETVAAGELGPERLRSAGVDLFTWSDQGPGHVSLHGKVLVVDSERVFVSSANMTERAFNDNFEVGLLVDDREVAEQLLRYVDSLIGVGLLAPI